MVPPLRAVLDGVTPQGGLSVLPRDAGEDTGGGLNDFELFERLEQFERALYRLIRPSPVGDLRPVRPLLMRITQIFDDLVLHLLF